MVAIKPTKEKNLTDFPLLYFKLIKVDPWNKSRLRFSFLIFCILLAGALAVILVYKTFDNDIEKAIEALHTAVFAIHAFGKSFVVWTTKSKLANILELNNHFVPITSFSPEIRAKCQSQWNFSRKLINTYLLSWSTAAFLFDFKIFITGEIQLALYVPEIQGAKYYIWLLLFYLSIATICISVGFDGMFLAVCSPAILQFEQLQEDFKKLNSNSLKKLVDYHNFLLDYCSKVNDMADLAFVVQYVTANMSLCLHLFIIFQQGEVDAVKSLLYTLFFSIEAMQIYLYCYAGELLTLAVCYRYIYTYTWFQVRKVHWEERASTTPDHYAKSSNADRRWTNSKGIADAVYDSEWYNDDIHRREDVRKAVVLITVRSQKVVQLNGRGMMRINLYTFMVVNADLVIKTMFSFYAVLNTIKS